MIKNKTEKIRVPIYEYINHLNNNGNNFSPKRIVVLQPSINTYIIYMINLLKESILDFTNNSTISINFCLYI